jgi:hypothetical protein
LTVCGGNLAAPTYCFCVRKADGGFGCRDTTDATPCPATSECDADDDCEAGEFCANLADSGDCVGCGPAPFGMCIRLCSNPF